VLIATKSKSYSYLDDDAQIVRPRPKEKFELPEVMPEFPGGDEALRQYIADNINYPESARKNGIQGTAYVSFKVTKEGEVTDVRLARGVHPPLDREAIRVVESMPDWKPAMTNGKPVDLPSYTVPVNFKIENPEVKVKSYAQSLVIPGPLYIVDGEETGSIKDIPHEDIKHIDVLKSPSATALFGQRGKDGVIMITTKQGAPENKIITELQLRKFIAEHIKYPVEAQQSGLQGMVSMLVDPGKSNQIVTPLKLAVPSKRANNGNNNQTDNKTDKYNNEDVYELGWVVVTGYGGDTIPSANRENNSPLFFSEVERVLQMLPNVDIPTIDKKLIRINVEFKLQTKE
ncbi:MAG: TonB family protein, partial [Mariniphaga sp.]